MAIQNGILPISYFKLKSLTVEFGCLIRISFDAHRTSLLGYQVEHLMSHWLLVQSLIVSRHRVLCNLITYKALVQWQCSDVHTFEKYMTSSSN